MADAQITRNTLLYSEKKFFEYVYILMLLYRYNVEKEMPFFNYYFRENSELSLSKAKPFLAIFFYYW